MSSMPVIGITLDIEHTPGYAPEPWYALRENYCSAIAAAGGLPLALPHEQDAAEHYLDLVDGLVISGGMYDIPPELYGETLRQGELVTKAGRTRFERKLIEGALARDLPLVGICGGMQLLAVLKGAKLIQDIPSEVKDSLSHMQPQPHHQAGHRVHLTPGTRLFQLFRQESLEVNSVHHQAVRDLPPEIIVSAVADDGIVEAIEIPGQHFCLGFQWHPEYLINQGERRLFEALVAAATQYRRHAAALPLAN